ncbi:ABC transporter, ATP-binding protein [Oesophagostomum dentatum]|uniref:ABC transporter, ATP-binding protein n=1 Tax=Oesophagostomum dentatum TaxID=61180 RepID=A0A0B1TMX7_OESDE|nr:ABC transporter, ATP-binding protein [Oesophagostomum dentatum]
MPRFEYRALPPLNTAFSEVYFLVHCILADCVKRTSYGVRAEDCFGLVGASGAGKTSTFDIITGLRFANDGHVFIGNQYVNSTQGIGYCPQFDAMLPRLSCRLNMTIIAGLIGYRYPEKVVEEMLRFLELQQHANKAFGRCSGGQRRRISIGVALLNPSKLVILDEPTAGIDPKTRHRVWALLQAVRISGRALLLSSHSMEECEAICSRIGILVKGRLTAIGPSQALKTMYVLFMCYIISPNDVLPDTK